MILKTKLKTYIYALSLIIVSGSCQQRDWRIQESPKTERERINQAAPINYVVIGDSTGLGLGARNGQGYVALLFSRIQEIYPEAHLVNLCTANATSSDILNNQISKITDLRPMLVTISIGANDMLRGVSENEFEINYEKILINLKNAGAPIVVTNIPDIASAPLLAKFTQLSIRSRVESFNTCIEQAAKRHNVYFVDLYEKSQGIIQSRPDFFSSDGLHPSDAGYKFWAEAMWPSVKKAISKS